MYGFLITLSIIFSSLIAEKLAKQKNLDLKIFWELIFWGFIGSIIGARLYHVIDLIEYYSKQPLNIFFIWNGGLGIIGAILGAIIASVVYLKLKKQPIYDFLDLGAVFFPISQAVGRIGNYLNKELYGKPTDSPLGIYIPPENRIIGYEPYTTYHPLFLYEMVLNLILFLVLWTMYKKNLKKGTIFYFFILGYSLIRFFLEFLRIEPWTINNINIAQALCIISIVISLGKLIYDIPLFRSWRLQLKNKNN